MAAHTRKNEHALRPDHEVLADIERTGRLMEEPIGLDMDALVKRSVAAYHVARDERAVDVSEAGSTLHWRADRRLSTWREFWADWAAVSAIVLVVAVWAVVRYGVSTATSAFADSAMADSFVPAALGVAGISVVCAWLYRNGNARHVVGAVAGAAFVAVAIGGFSTSIGNINATAALARTQLEQASLNLMFTRQVTGQFNQLSMTGSTFSLFTDQASRDRAVYYATAEGVPGRIVADVSPSSGTITWSDSRRSYEAKLFSGTLKEVTDDALVVQNANGETLRVKRGGAPFPSLKIGNAVMGAYDAKTQEASVVMAGPTPGS
jgi:hypothetical protein